MKQFHRLIALLLCGALLLALCACTEKQDPTKPTDPTSATDAPVQENSALQLYEKARSAVDAAQDISLRISVKKTTTVGGETFKELSDQTLTFKGIGTDSLRVYSDDQRVFGSFSLSFQEYYADGTVYLITGDVSQSGDPLHSARSSCTEEEFLSRHYPTVMLDSSLYQNITVTEGEKLTTLTMTEPTGAESWVLPEGAQFISSSGLARINADGILQFNEYHVEYLYGNSTVQLEVSVHISLKADDIVLPEKARSFPKLSSVDTIYLQFRAAGYMAYASKLSATSHDIYYSIPDQYETDYIVTVHFNSEGRMFRTKSQSVYVDYKEGISEDYTFEDYFVNKLYHVVQDEQDSMIGTVSWTEANYNSMRHIQRYMIAPTFWKTATITDLGLSYFIEFTYDDSIALAMAEATCEAIYDDPQNLYESLPKHKTSAITGYLAVDKFSGLPTASGIYYIGSFVGNGYEFPLVAQVDTTIHVPSLGAYKAITEEMPEEKKPENPATPLFYHVTGADGQEMWLLGTVHVGDEHTAYLPQEIYDAFDSADALAMEFDIHAFEKQLETDEALQETIARYYLYEDGSYTMDHLDRGVYNDAIKFLKASGNYNMQIDYLRPYFWTSMLDNFYLQQGYRLTSDQGVEIRLTQRAHAQNKKILEVESAESQVAMMAGFSDELQEYLLEETMSVDPIAYWEDLNRMYDTWCVGDEEAMRKYLSTDPDMLEEMGDEELALYEEYRNAMHLERNRAMLETAIEYLESGETVFFAVGLAHLLVDEGLVDTLENAGYTVELVSYNE